MGAGERAAGPRATASTACTAEQPLGESARRGGGCTAAPRARGTPTGSAARENQPEANSRIFFFFFPTNVKPNHSGRPLPKGNNTLFGYLKKKKSLLKDVLEHGRENGRQRAPDCRLCHVSPPRKPLRTRAESAAAAQAQAAAENHSLLHRNETGRAVHFAPSARARYTGFCWIQ